MGPRARERDYKEWLAAKSLAEHLWHEGADHERIRGTFTSREPTESWDEMPIAVDGEPVVFRSLSAGASWIAVGHVADVLVALEGGWLGDRKSVV